MDIDSWCAKCSNRKAIRCLGTTPYCHECAESFLAPLREQYKPMGLKHAVIDRELDKDEYAELDAELEVELFHMHCVTCQRRWIGDGFTNCERCMEYEATQREYQTKRVLFPSDDDLYE